MIVYAVFFKEKCLNVLVQVRKEEAILFCNKL
jgi:hypothetical protein